MMLFFHIFAILFVVSWVAYAEDQDLEIFGHARPPAQNPTCKVQTCPKKGSALLPHKLCRKYYLCYNGRKYEMNCYPSSYRFSVDKKNCVPERQANCRDCEDDDDDHSGGGDYHPRY